ncbi:integrase catalytic domain-containing protein [Trichonephila clavipes]|nr:integrase catalytic domain-containing protein [Trichonephila clavipes]
MEIKNNYSSFAEPVNFLIVDKITEFTPSSSLDISNVEIPKFLTLADKSFYEANEVHALISADIFFKVLKQNTYKVNEELFFKESEFRWIACGKLKERQINKQGQCFLVNNYSIQDTLKLFIDLEENPNNELSDNYPLAKQRFQNLWRRFGHDSELYQQYREIIRDYTEQGIIEEVKTKITDNELKRPIYYLPHQAFKSPFLLAVTIRHHIEKYKHEFPDTVELLDRNFYVDDLISGGNEFEEALQTSRRAKNIMEAAGMDFRKWISNYANLMEQWQKENFNVHPVHETVSLGANGTKILGLSWNTNEDYLTTGIKSLLEFVSLDKNTKRFILQAVGKIFDPLGLISPFTVRMKCLLQDLWKEDIQWDDPLPTHIEKEWKKWHEELPRLRNLKIPRLVLDSTLLEDDVELHSFCDASKKAYGTAIYLRTKSRNGISVKLVTSKSRVAPLNCVTLPRLALLGALVAARLASKVNKIGNLKRSCLQYHWIDSKIVLFWIKGNKTRWKQFVANRGVNEITSLTDPHSWNHCTGKENPADFLSRELSADCLVSNSRWWTGAENLSDSEFPKNFQQVVPELDTS